MKSVQMSKYSDNTALNSDEDHIYLRATEQPTNWLLGCCLYKIWIAKYATKRDEKWNRDKSKQNITRELRTKKMRNTFSISVRLMFTYTSRTQQSHDTHLYYRVGHFIYNTSKLHDIPMQIYFFFNKKIISFHSIFILNLSSFFLFLFQYLNLYTDCIYIRGAKRHHICLSNNDFHKFYIFVLRKDTICGFRWTGNCWHLIKWRLIWKTKLNSLQIP